jgi:hypothetical protein
MAITFSTAAQLTSERVQSRPSKTISTPATPEQANTARAHRRRGGCGQVTASQLDEVRRRTHKSATVRQPAPSKECSPRWGRPAGQSPDHHHRHLARSPPAERTEPRAGLAGSAVVTQHCPTLPRSCRLVVKTRTQQVRCRSLMPTPISLGYALRITQRTSLMLARHALPLSLQGRFTQAHQSGSRRGPGPDSCGCQASHADLGFCRDGDGVRRQPPACWAG